jgi:predicted Zn-dependent protease
VTAAKQPESEQGRGQKSSLRLVAAALSLLILAGVSYYLIYPQVAASLHWRRAQRALAEHDLSSAQNQLRRCLEVWPDSSETHFLLARTCRRLGDYAAAESELARARQLGWVRELLDLEGLLLQAETGRVKEVESRLRSILTEGHRDAALIVEALVTGWLQGQFMAEAYTLTTDWLQQHPDDWYTRYLQGGVLESGMRYDLAIADYERVVADRPDFPPAHSRLAEVLLVKGRPAEALPHFQVYLEREPADAAAWYGLARCERQAGSAARSRAALERLLAIEPDHAGGLLLRGQLELDNNQPEQALTWFRRAESLTPLDRGVCINVATALRQLGRPNEAAPYEQRRDRILKDLHRLDALVKQSLAEPKNAAPRGEAGKILLGLDQERKALPWLASALLLDPGNAAARDALGECLRKTQNAAIRETCAGILRHADQRQPATERPLGK